MSKTLACVSKDTYFVRGDDGKPTFQEVHTGCLQRIATACEATAKNWNQMQADLEYYKRRSKENYEACERLNRSSAALRGVISRMKKTVAKLNADVNRFAVKSMVAIAKKKASP
jgi:predicted RNase H-like nuclease (RuvC/YqgF family)